MTDVQPWRRKRRAVTDNFQQHVVIPASDEAPDPPGNNEAAQLYRIANTLFWISTITTFTTNFRVATDVTIGDASEPNVDAFADFLETPNQPSDAQARVYYDDKANTFSGFPGLRVYAGGAWNDLVSERTNFTPVIFDGGALTLDQINGRCVIFANMAHVYIRFKYSANSGGTTAIELGDLPAKFLPIPNKNAYIPLYGRCDFEDGGLDELTKCRVENATKERINLRIDAGAGWKDMTANDIPSSATVSVQINLPLR